MRFIFISSPNNDKYIVTVSVRFAIITGTCKLLTSPKRLTQHVLKNAFQFI